VFTNRENTCRLGHYIASLRSNLRQQAAFAVANGLAHYGMGGKLCASARVLNIDNGLTVMHLLRPRCQQNDTGHDPYAESDEQAFVVHRT
jgi:hypothetical protein